MSLYKTFQTDPNLEANGVVIDYGDTRVTVARSGGANKQYMKLLEAKMKPYRRAIQTDMMDRKKLTSLMQEVLIEGSIRKWEELENDAWVEGVRLKDGQIVPFTKEAILQVFKDLPDLYDDLQQQSASLAIFRQEVLEEDAKN